MVSERIFSDKIYFLIRSERIFSDREIYFLIRSERIFSDRVVSEPVIIEKSNSEANIGKVITTKDNLNIRCRLNHIEDHSWHSNNSQLNLIVDLIYNFYINWDKKQEDLEQKLEDIYKEQKQFVEQYSFLNNKLNTTLELLEDYKTRQNKILQNSDYIKELLEIINSSKGKEIVLASTGIITSSQAINSEKWTYLGVSLEE